MAIEISIEVTRDKLKEYISMLTQGANWIKFYSISLKKSISSISKEVVNHEVAFESLMP